MSAEAIPEAKLKAIKTLGISFAKAAALGLIPLSAVPACEEADASAVPAKRKADDEPSDSNLSQQEQDRRKAAAERFAARSKGEGAPGRSGSAAGAASAETTVASDESIIDALQAACKFIDPQSGNERIFSPHASDVAFLISDAIFWPLLRRLAVEVATLEAGKSDVEDFWKDSPQGSEGALKFAELRGYVLPTGLAAPAANSFWRKALLSEVATDVLLVRMQAGRGLDLPALAGPAFEVSGSFVQNLSDNLEGIASAVDTSASVGLAEELVKALGTAVSVAEQAGASLRDRLAKVAEAALKAGPVKTTNFEAADAPALRTTGWSLMQEMGVREVSMKLRQEYSVRRQILLKRLDCSVQSCTCGERALTAAGQRKVADVLSRMWAGWRRNIADAPPLSEWSALAVTRGIIARTVQARVAGPGSRVSSAVKSIMIGKVPDRGGIPDGYMKDRKEQQGQASAPSSTPTAKKARTGSSINTVSTGTGAAPQPAAKDAAAGEKDSEGAAQGSSEAPAGSASGAGASAGGGKDEKEGEPISIGSKQEEKKGTKDGARSANKELEDGAEEAKKKEREDPARKNTYYEDLTVRRH